MPLARLVRDGLHDLGHAERFFQVAARASAQGLLGDAGSLLFEHNPEYRNHLGVVVNAQPASVSHTVRHLIPRTLLVIGALASAVPGSH
ncbi:MAG: hypothetical protein AAB226_07530, partial [candidate division NC10 bacterium]